MKSDNPSRDYKKLAKKLIKNSNSLLDIDTGGGEVLLSLSPLPRKSYATEGYKPNVKIAKNNLKKVGVRVIYADSAHKLPFKDETFDLAAVRGGYDARCPPGPISEKHGALRSCGDGCGRG